MKQIRGIFYFFMIFFLLGYMQNIVSMSEQIEQKQLETVRQTTEKEILKKEAENRNTIENNGGFMIQAADLIYYIASDYHSDQDAVYSMDLDGMNQKKLFNIGFTHGLYAMDHFIFTSYYDSKKSKSIIVRYSIDTGELIEFAEGSLDYIDSEKKEIYYSKPYPSEGFFVDSWDLWKMDSEGENHTPIIDGYTFVEKVENVIYLERFDQNRIDVVLASIKEDGTDFKILAAIPRWSEKFLDKEYIFGFVVFGDWIILNRGSYQGNIGNYYGGLVRLKKDGSELEQLPFHEEGDIKVFDGWIYFNNYRFRPDSTEKELLGEQEGWLFSFFEGYLYYVYRPEENKKPINHFYQYDVKQNQTVQLFDGNNVPFFEDSTYINYIGRQKIGDYIYFAVEVSGYTEKDTWRGHTCYYGYYRIKRDGSGLQLIYEDETKKCPNE